MTRGTYCTYLLAFGAEDDRGPARRGAGFWWLLGYLARRALSERGAACWPAGEHAPTYVRRAKLAQSSGIGIVIADLVRLNLVMSLVRPTKRTYVGLDDSSDAKACARA